MNLPHLENDNAETVKSATAVLRRARRRYSAAVARIGRAEAFVAKHVDGLGYESQHLYGETEPFECPQKPVIVGLTRHMPQRYSLFFTKRAGEWHFFVAPTTSDSASGTTIMSDVAIPLVNAPAEVVLYCVDTIERYAVEILEHLAVVVAVASGDEAALTPPKPNQSKKLPVGPPKRAIH